MPVEEMIEEYGKLQEEIQKAMKRQSEIIKAIQNAGDDDFDWIPVKKASELLGCSVCVVYQKINAGELKVKHIRSKKLVSRKEILEIDDTKTA